MSSLDLLCTTTGEDEQRHVRDRLEEYQVAHFCFSEEQRRADGSPAPTTSFYIADLHLEWARDRLADFFRGGSSVLIARTTDDVVAMTYRAALEDRDIGYTTSRSARQYPMVTIGPLAETLFFVAEVDVEAARRAIEDVGTLEAPISEQELAEEAVPEGPPADGTEPDRQ